MKKMILEARINEYAMRDENPHVPWTPDEIAESAARCLEAAASIKPVLVCWSVGFIRRAAALIEMGLVAHRRHLKKRF